MSATSAKVRRPTIAGVHALLAGVVFLVLAGVMLAPVIHHVLQRFHLETDENKSSRPD